MKETGIAFWDLVVLTGRDETQAQAYRDQLDKKLQRQELPRGVTFRVFADPPGPKIGEYIGNLSLWITGRENIYSWIDLEQFKQSMKTNPS